MSKPLNVIALISGGKDSLFTLLHCIQNGHKVVALGNVYPKLPENAHSDASEDKDINSFMYQTVGHSVIPLFAEALQLPLYRQQIAGTSTQTGRYYDSSLVDASTDETEDLIPLLEEVMKVHPEVNALCSGAILSTYQRTRIESVALRLGLTPLAYLWQYPFLAPPSARLDSLTGLLDDMNAAGCDSRIIKIASGGMPEDLLWANLAHVKTMKRIVSNMALFFEDDEPGLRGAVLGEGGEFETLALDGPRQLWKSRIDIDVKENSVVSEEGGVKWLRVGQGKVIEQDTDTRAEVRNDIVRVPGTLDPQFEHMTAMQLRLPNPETEDYGAIGILHAHESLRHTYTFSLGSNTVSIANINCNNLFSDAAQQMQQIVSEVRKILSNISTTHNLNPPLSPAFIISTTILLASMSSFPSVNTSYSQLFQLGLPNPPARVTIASALPPSTLVSLSCIVSLLPRSTHRGLHVQSRSYWAPANIGPYSQAVAVPVELNDESDQSEFVHVAGQIPLVPATMEMLQAPFVEQAVLALQHLWRVGQERGVDLWTWGVAFLPRLDEEEDRVKSHVAAEIWRAAHMTTVDGTAIRHCTRGAEDEDEDDGDDDQEPGPDAWDLKYDRRGAGRAVLTVGKHRHILPNSAAIASSADRTWIPPVIVAEVEELPRSAPIEWHSHGLGGLPKHPSATTRVATGSFKSDWCTVSICSYLRNRESERDHSEDEDHAMTKSGRSDCHFVTVQVHANAMISNEKKIETLSAVLEHVIPHASALLFKNDADSKMGGTQSPETERHASCVYGAAYLSSMHGETAFAALGGLEAMPGIAVIHCQQLWANCDPTDVMADGRSGVVKLSVALSLRIDTIVGVEI